MKKISFLIAFFLVFLFCTAFSIKCGTWRWNVKTLTDNSQVNWFHVTPTPITIRELITQPPKNLSLSTDIHLKRFPGKAAEGGESELAVMDVFIYRIKTTEDDHDYHLLLSSKPNKQGDKMDGEIPNPDCSNIAGNQDLIKAFTQARAVADKIVKQLNAGEKSVHVRLTGVPFWDALHGSAGAAPNGREIHPIIKMEILSQNKN